MGRRHGLSLPGMVILDASPIFEGYVVDTSTSYSQGDNDAHEAAKADDLVYRRMILEAVLAGATFREIATTVDADLARRCYRNCHRLHPEAVLGHRVVRLINPAAAPSPDPSGFDPTVLAWAVEPHLAGGAIGVKWEELLVVEADDAYWLDDDVPHLART